MVRPVRSRPFEFGPVFRYVCIVLSVAAAASTAWSQQADDFARGLPSGATGNEELVALSQCTLRPSPTVEAESIRPNALSRARALADAAASGGSPVPGDRPSLVDNSTLMYFPPIMPQPLGDCTCYSSGYYYNTYTQARDEGLDASTGNEAVVCSPRFIFSLICQAHYGAECTEHVMARLADVGCSNAALHWFYKDYTEWPSEAAWIQALENRTGTPHKIQANTTDGLEAIKQHIANGGCVVTRGVVGENYPDYPDNSLLGIDNRVYYSREYGLRSRHSVCIVGYDDTRSYVDHRDGHTYQGAFLAANSKGTSWGWYNSTETGSRGFFWLGYKMFLDEEFGYYDDDWSWTDPCYDNPLHPEVYYNDDRPQYRPRLYAVTGISHEKRSKLTLTAGIGPTDDALFTGPYVITPTQRDQPAINCDERVAVDLTDGAHHLSPDGLAQLFVELGVDGSAGAPGAICSADFHEDVDCDGAYKVVSSTDPPVDVPSDDTGYATAQISGAPVHVYVDDSNTEGPWDGTPEHPYQTIQDGIDNAPLAAYVRVLPGTYNEGIELTGSAHIVGSGAPLTTIDTLNADEAVYAAGVASAILEELTITAGPDYHAVRSTDTTLMLRGCVITASKNGCGADGGGLLELDNCLVAGNAVSGLWQNGSTTDVRLANCTVCDNGTYGVARWGSGSSTITMRDTIVTGNGDDIAGDPAGYEVTYSDIGDGDFAGSDGNITVDPQFVSGPYHSYCLSQTAAGQGSDSPCVDAGSDTGATLGLDGTTTRTDAVPDGGTVDMGYHAWPHPVITAIDRDGDDVAITWNARSDVSYVVEWSANLSAWSRVPVGEAATWTDFDCGPYWVKYYRVCEDTFEDSGAE
jgi:hypothetical protein